MTARPAARHAPRPQAKKWAGIVRIAAGFAAGGTLGLAFGAAFGALAHVFAGGPTVAQGVIESAPFFALCGALGGAVVATE